MLDKLLEGVFRIVFPRIKITFTETSHNKDLFEESKKFFRFIVNKWHVLYLSYVLKKISCTLGQNKGGGDRRCGGDIALAKTISNNHKGFVVCGHGKVGDAMFRHTGRHRVRPDRSPITVVEGQWRGRERTRWNLRFTKFTVPPFFLPLTSRCDRKLYSLFTGKVTVGWLWSKTTLMSEYKAGVWAPRGPHQGPRRRNVFACETQVRVGTTWTRTHHRR